MVGVLSRAGLSCAGPFGEGSFPFLLFNCFRNLCLPVPWPLLGLLSQASGVEPGNPYFKEAQLDLAADGERGLEVSKRCRPGCLHSGNRSRAGAEAFAGMSPPLGSRWAVQGPGGAGRGQAAPLPDFPPLSCAVKMGPLG